MVMGGRGARWSFGTAEGRRSGKMFFRGQRAAWFLGFGCEREKERERMGSGGC